MPPLIVLPNFVFNYCKADYNGLYIFLSIIDFSACERLSNMESIWSFIKNGVMDGNEHMHP